MNFKIIMYIPRTGHTIDMPGMQNLGLFEAERYVRIYKNRNPDCTYHIVNQSNGDFEFSV